jgi:hypothetical protein
MSEWDNITGFQQWSDKLDELLGAAEALASDSGTAARLAASRRFRDFIDNSWPNDEAIKALDEIAARAAQDLMLDTVDARLREIAGRTAELRQITKQFRDQAAAVGARATEIRLQKAHRVAQSLTESVHLLKDLRSELSEADDGDLVKNVGRAVETIQKLRALIERET